MEEIEAAMGGFSVAGPSSQPDPVALVFGPPTQGNRCSDRLQHQGAGEAWSKGRGRRLGDEEGCRCEGPEGQGQGEA